MPKIPFIQFIIIGIKFIFIVRVKVARIDIFYSRIFSFSFDRIRIFSQMVNEITKPFRKLIKIPTRSQRNAIAIKGKNIDPVYIH